MALNNLQYENIMREYEAARSRNRHIAKQREEEIRRTVPEYEALVQETSRLAGQCARLLLEEDNLSALHTLREQLAELAEAKSALLCSHGYPADYLAPLYDCPDCQDTGYVEASVGSDAGRTKCHCLRRREMAILYEQSNIREIIRRENFTTLSYDYYEGEDRRRFQDTVNISLDFVQNFKQDYQNLFFYGTVGTGKSFLSGCIANELLKEGYSVIYFSAAGLFDTLARYSFDAKSKENLYNFYKDLYNCDLVIIDDLGTEVTNSFVTSQLFACLNERHLRRKSTIISTNLNLEELRDRYSDRVFSRILSNFTSCKFSGRDIRLYRKRTRNQ